MCGSNYAMQRSSRVANILTSIFIASFVTPVGAQESPQPPTDIKSLTSLAEQGNSQAQYELGLAYDLGDGVRRNLGKAERWYRQAAETGHPDAQNAVGSILQERRKYREAVTWYERAAAQGFPRAINNLAYMHDLGLGVSQNRARAFTLYSEAADHGWAEAMWNLANMYVLGQSVEPSYLQGCIWSFRARQFAHPAEAVLLKRVAAGINEIEGRLSTEELNQCRSEALAWTPAASTTS